MDLHVLLTIKNNKKTALLIKYSLLVTKEEINKADRHSP